MPVEPQLALLFDLWVAEREFRGPGCDAEACRIVQAVVPGCFGRSEILVHSASTHEAYGRAQVEEWAPAVRLGPLVVDVAAGVASVDGRELKLTYYEWCILRYLAERIDRVCEYAAISDAVWGEGWHFDAHPVRVIVCRLRAKLGPAGHLIRMERRRGYRLTRDPEEDS